MKHKATTIFKNYVDTYFINVMRTVNCYAKNEPIKHPFHRTALLLPFKILVKSPWIVTEIAAAQDKLLGRSKSEFEAAWSPIHGTCFDLVKNLRSGIAVDMKR